MEKRRVSSCGGEVALGSSISSKRKNVLLVHLVEGARAGCFMTPNVRAKGAPTVGRQARLGENVPRTARPGLVARRWCSL
jgi:hypothetical protein